MRRLSALVTALLSSLAFSPGRPREAAAPVQTAVLVGVVAAVNDEVAKKQADALASFVAIAVKETTLPRVYPDQEALALAVSKGEVDVALMGPLALPARSTRRRRRSCSSAPCATARAPTARCCSPRPAASSPRSTLLKKSKTPLKVAWVETSSATGYVIPKATAASRRASTRRRPSRRRTSSARTTRCAPR